MADVTYIFLNLAGFALALGVAIFWLTRLGTAALSVQPAVAFSVYFGMVHFFVPIYKLISGKYRYPGSYSGVVMIYTSMMSLAVFCFILALLRNPGRGYDGKRFGENQPHANIAFWVGALITATGVFAMFMVTREIDAIGYDVFLSDRILYSTQIGFFTRIDTVVLPGMALILAGNLNRPGRKLFSWAIFIGVGAYAINYYNIMQSRNSIILMFVTLGSILFFYRNKPLRLSGKGFKTIFTAMLALILFGGLAYQVTAARYSGVQSSFAQSALNNMLFIILDGPFGNDENLLWLSEYGHHYLWGQSYVAGFTNLVPRSIWPDKPWGAGPEMRNLVYPGSYVLGAEGNTSVTTGLQTEAQMNFGLPGIFAIASLWVWIVSSLVRSLLRTRTVFSQTMLIFIMIFMSTAFVHSEFLGFFSRLVTCIVISLIYYTILRMAGFQKLNTKIF